MQIDTSPARVPNTTLYAKGGFGGGGGGKEFVLHLSFLCGFLPSGDLSHLHEF